MKINKAMRLLIRLFCSVTLIVTVFFNTVNAENTKDISINDCKELNKKDLFAELNNSFYSDNKARYSSLISCLRQKKGVVDSDYIEVVFRVAASKDELYLLEIVDSMKNVNLQLPGGDTVLHFAIENGALKTVKRILDKGGNANLRSAFNALPLEVAMSKDIQLFELLLKNTKLEEGEVHKVASSIISHSSSKRAQMLELFLEKYNLEIDECALIQLKTRADKKTDKHLIKLIDRYIESKKS